MSSFAYDHRVVHRTTIIALVLACLLSPALLNGFISYSVSGGTFFEKLHPFAYVIGVGWLIDFVIIKKVRIRHPSRTSILIFFWLILGSALAFKGKSGQTAVILNNFVFPLLLFGLLTKQNSENLLLLGRVFLFMMFIQSITVFVEFWMGQSFFDVRQEVAYFRPPGFSGHPLNAGQFAVLAMLMTRFTVRNSLTARALLLLFFSSLLVIGSRSALLLGAGIVVLEMLHPYSASRSSRITSINVGFLFLLILAGLISLISGGLDRFIERGLWDVSAQSRVSIFNIFDIMDSSEISNGIEYDRLDYYLEFLKLNYVESAFVAQLVIGGVFFAVAAHILIIVSFLPILRVSPSFFATIMVLLVSSLGFSSKGVFPFLAYFLAAVVLGMCKSTRSHNRKFALGNFRYVVSPFPSGKLSEWNGRYR